MTRYKGVTYWWNDTRGQWLAQCGYEIVASARTEGAIKAKITRYINKQD